MSSQPSRGPWDLPSEERTGTYRVGIEPTTDEHLKEYLASWMPAMLNDQTRDLDFTWTEDLRRESSNPHFEMVSLVDQDQRLHGLMSLRLANDSPESPGEQIVYIEMVAVHPLARTLHKPKRSILGVGTKLIVYAIERSLSLGFGGRLGLHSLEDEDTLRFYREGCSMTDIGDGIEPEPKLRYFLLDAATARALLDRLRQRR